MNQKLPPEPKTRRPSKLLKIAILLVGLAAFRGEIMNVLGWGYWLLRLLAGLPGQAPSVKPAFALAAMLATSASFFILALLLTSHGVLPTRTFKEQIEVFYHLLRHFFRLHGPAIDIKEGKIIGNAEEMKTARPGLAFVDQASAIVLEKQWATSAPQPATSRAAAPVQGTSKPRLLRAFARRRSPEPARKGEALVRVSGPGIIFSRPGEKVRGVAHLRKQVRRAEDIHAYTSDGIEVFANVFVTFTLGQAPKVIKVALAGADNPENLRVVEIDPMTKRITAIADHLDMQDKGEIFRSAMRAKASGFPSAPLLPDQEGREYPPFEVNDERIFSAIYSQARNIQDRSVDDWTDLPVRVAVKVYRNMLSRHTYDTLYEPGGPNKELRLLAEFKPAFDARLQGLGVLSYQFIRRRDSAPVQVGDVVNRKSFLVSAAEELHSPKELRSRGIKVIHAGFSELKPVNPAVMEQRLQAWRARWQGEADHAKSDLDLEMMRIRNRSRMQTQREVAFSLSQLYRSTGNSQETLAVRLVRALEEAAADPATSQLLPQDTVEKLRDLRAWLLPEEQAQSGAPDDGAQAHGPMGDEAWGDGTRGDTF